MWLTILKILAGLTIYSAGIEPRIVVRNDEPASIPDLPAAWEGKQVAVFADLQVGMWWANTDAARRLVSQVIHIRPAFVLVAGDEHERWAYVNHLAHQPSRGVGVRPPHADLEVGEDGDLLPFPRGREVRDRSRLVVADHDSRLDPGRVDRQPRENLENGQPHVRSRSELGSCQLHQQLGQRRSAVAARVAG